MILGLCLFLTGCAGRMFYYPNSRVYHQPEEAQLTHEEVLFEAADGVHLHGWFLPAVGEAKGTVIHFHGNAQNITAHFAFAFWLPREGFNLFVFDYRGYGKSEGSPTRRGLQQDGAAAIRYVATRKDVDPERLLILGATMSWYGVGGSDLG